MGSPRNKRFFTMEYLFVAAYLFVFATILLSSDPAWLLWAGPIVLGAFPLSVPPSLPIDPVEAIRAASAGAFAGLLVVSALALAVFDSPPVR